jgi:hypothetical protein
MTARPADAEDEQPPTLVAISVLVQWWSGDLADVAEGMSDEDWQPYTF